VPPTPTVPEPPAVVDAEVSAEETVLRPNLKRVQLEVSGLAEQGGVLEITTSNTEQVNIVGDCPERVCTVPAGTTFLDFAVNGLQIDEFTTVFFNVTPAGDAIDPNTDNNTVQVELDPVP